jgi:hypothetical protein
MQKQYFRERLWEAVERLPQSEDVLVEVLAEILEDTG